jgi:hypothetical protein
MKKKGILAFALVASMGITSIQAKDLNTALAGICAHVKADDKTRLRKKLKENHIKLRAIYDGITCSGSNLIEYAIKNDSGNVGKYMVGKMPKGHFDKIDYSLIAKSAGKESSEILVRIASR